MLERESELAELRGRIEDAAGGRGSVVVIEGPAGIGKTTLLEAARRAAGERMQVLAARAGRLERELSWNVVRELFGRVVRSAPEKLLTGAAALAAPALGFGGESEAGALHGLYWLTSDLAAQMPLMLAVDDAHWGDASSLQFLNYVGGRVADLPVLVVVTTRPGEDDRGLVDPLGAGPGSSVIQLRGLSAGGSASVVRSQMEGADEDFCTACHEATAGNPFLLNELTGQLGRDGVEPSTREAGEVARITPEAVRRAVLLRLSRLDPPSRDLASAVAILGADVAVAEAAELAGLDPEAAAGASDELARIEILKDEPTLEFVHPIVREVLYAEISAPKRGRLHADAARLLAERGAAPQRVASQLLEVGSAADPVALDWLARAASDAIAGGAPAEAVPYLERALEEGPESGPRIELLRTLAAAELNIDQASAVSRLAEALDLSSGAQERAELSCELAAALVFTMDVKRADAVLDAALELGDELDRELRLRVEALKAGIAAQDPELRGVSVERLRELLPEVEGGSTHSERLLLALLAALTRAEVGDADRAARWGRRALSDGALLEELGAESPSFWYAPSGLLFAEQYEECERVAAAGMAQAQRRGSVLGFSLASWFMAATRQRAGRIVEAEADVLQSLDSGLQAGGGPALMFAAEVLTNIALDRGQPDLALEALERIGAMGELPPGFGPALALHSRGRLRWATGARGAGVEDIRRAREELERFEYGAALLPFRSQAALILAEDGDGGTPSRLVEDELAEALAYGARRPIGLALRAKALLGEGDERVKLLTESVEVLSGSPSQLDFARAQIDLGAALRRTKRRRDAMGPLQEGLQTASALGATALAERAREELEVAGAKPRRDPGERDELTASELRVARMAAAGMTNREVAAALFVSLRTVETHLTHAYRKLEIGSRRELEAALERRGAGEG